MKREKNLYNKICSFENILDASRKARKGKRKKNSTAVFEVNLEKEIHEIKNELALGNYKCGNYKEFFITEPKKRMISAAPYKDRVVHHALCNVIEPIFDKSFIFDSYANRKGKGTHKAILRYQFFSRYNKYALKCDIKKYFPSIDHIILKNLIRKKIGCNKTISLIENIIDNSNDQESVVDYFCGDDLFTPFERKRGLPIGNLTSQFFANIYLNPLDHFIKENLKCKCYVRYVDDFVLLGNNKSDLFLIKKSIVDFLEKLRIKLNEKKSMVYKTEKGVKFLGHKIFPNYRLLKKENKISFKRKINVKQKLCSENKLSLEKFIQSLNSWNAHSAFSNTIRLRRKIFNQINNNFTGRIKFDESTFVARRLLEQ